MAHISLQHKLDQNFTFKLKLELVQWQCHVGNTRSHLKTYVKEFQVLPTRVCLQVSNPGCRVKVICYVISLTPVGFSIAGEGTVLYAMLQLRALSESYY